MTISLIIPITFGIYNVLTNSLSEMKTQEGKTLCSSLIESVKKRLFPYEQPTVTKVATLLDPRFKKEGFRINENAENAATLLEQDMHSIMQKKRANSTEDHIQSGLTESNDLGFLGQRLAEKVKSVTADVIITKRQYLEKVNTVEESDPLLFWKVL